MSMDSSPIAHQLSEEPRSEADEPGCQNEQEDEQIGSPAQLIGQLGVANEQREDQNEGEVPTPKTWTNQRRSSKPRNR
jgi:hypothetical protein